MLIYILKSAACLAILLFFYKFLLEKESMHVFKRFYLLGSLLFSLTVPALVFTEYKEIIPVAKTSFQENPVLIINQVEVTAANVFDFEPVLWGIYFIGIVLFGIVFLKNLFQIIRRIKYNPKYKNSNFIQVLLCEKLPPHTFFKYIFLNKTRFESNAIPKEVILHEETHACQKHSIDVILIELLQVLFWINPLFYFFKKAIKLNHEFLADQAVLNKDIDTTTYQNTLLSFLSSENDSKQQSMLSSAINYSSIKKRFTIMKTKTSKKAFLIRSLLLLPILAVMLYGFSEKKAVYKKEKTLLPSPNIENQSDTELSNFEILATNTENGIKFNCVEGCVWKELEFSLTNNKQQLLDKYGTVSSQNTKPERKLDNFLISVAKTKKEFVLKGLHGTNWKGLTFSFPETAPSKINQFGVATQQNTASKKQLSEYNALAKKYNTMLKGNHFTIKKSDVDRLEYLHSIMSEVQRSNSEPFPDFPEPPTAPNAPKVENIDVTRIVEEMVIKEQFFQTDFPAAPNLAYRKSNKPLTDKVQKAINTFTKKKEDYHTLIERQLKNINIDKSKIETTYDEVLEAYNDYKVLAIEEGVFAQASPAFGRKIKLQMPKAPAKSPQPPVSPLIADKEFAEKQIQEIVENQDPYDHISKVIYSSQKNTNLSTPPESPMTTMIDVPVSPEQAANRLREELKNKNTNGDIIAVETKGNQFYISTPRSPAIPSNSTLKKNQSSWVVTSGSNRDSRNTEVPSPIPPVTPTIGMHVDRDNYSKELKKSINEYLELNKNYEEAIADYRNKNIGDKENLWKMYNDAMEKYVAYHVIAKKDDNFVQPVPAFKEYVEFKNNELSVPPTPPSPLNLVIELAKKDATFFYKKKKIASDEAIAILKKNKNLSMDVSKSKSGKHIVKIDTHF